MEAYIQEIKTKGPDTVWNSKSLTFIWNYLFFFQIEIFFSFDVDHFKVFIEFVTILLLFYVWVFWPQGTWGLSSLTRDPTCTPCVLNHWTTREVPPHILMCGYWKKVKKNSCSYEFCWDPVLKHILWNS